MTPMSERDKKLLCVIALLVMVGTLGLWFPKAKAAWQTTELQLARQEAELARSTRIVNRRATVEERYEALRAQMPIFPEGKSVDTYWLPIMDNIARTNGVNIAQRSIGKEENLGDVTELTIECRDWEGTLDSLVWFIYDLETRKEAMMDIRAITVKPNAKKPGTLQGTFTLNCAYMRQAAE